MQSEIKVICVGNITVGGSGKTPVALAFGRLLEQLGLHYAFLGHGYKANALKMSACLEVDLEMHNSLDVGDEALLLRRQAQTYIAKDRLKAVVAAQHNDFECVILDDGMQDNSIHKDFLITVVDSEYILGNSLFIPAGPLREKPEAGLNRADLVLISGTERNKCDLAIKNLIVQFQQVIDGIESKITSCILKPINFDGVKEGQFFAFLGIGRPQKFLDTAASCGIKIKEYKIFPDHHTFTSSELETLYNHAKYLGCYVLTSSKDFIRLPRKYKKLTQVLEVEAQFEDPDFILSKIRKKLGLQP